MQMPFLQRVMPGLRIVPLLMGTQSREEVDALASALARSAPGARRRARGLERPHPLPARTRSRADSTPKSWPTSRGLDPEALMRRLEARDERACGGGPIVAVMKAARALGADRATRAALRGQRRRGRTTSRTSWGTCRPRSRRAIERGAPGQDGARARRARAAEPARGRARGDRRAPRGPPRRAAATAAADAGHGAFVTLRRTRDGELRGCVGQLESSDPLVETVAAMAVAAATRDGRFDPVTAGELASLRGGDLGAGIAAADRSRRGRGRAPRPAGEPRRPARGAAAAGRGRARLGPRALPGSDVRKAGLPADAWRQPGIADLAASPRRCSAKPRSGRRRRPRPPGRSRSRRRGRRRRAPRARRPSAQPARPTGMRSPSTASALACGLVAAVVLEQAGRDHVDRDAAARFLEGERLRERHDTGLGRGVGGHLRLAVACRSAPTAPRFTMRPQRCSRMWGSTRRDMW